VDIPTLGRELDWLRDEVNRLQGLLVRHGIEPGSAPPGSAPRPEPIQQAESVPKPEDPTQQSA
jgi:hypothetical protein